MPATTHTAQYHYLICIARIDNIVEGTCGRRSPGKWHDGELLEKEMEQKGWTRTPKGWLCPDDSAEARREAAGEKASRKPVKRADADAAPAGDWTASQ